MLIDSLLMFASDQVLTVAAASQSSIDFGSDRDVGVGEPLWIVLVSKAAPGGASPTLQLSVETDDNSAFSSAETTVTFPAIAGADFAAGTIVAYPFPLTNQQHTQVKFTPGGTSPTFTVDCFLTSQEPKNWQAYPDAI